MKIVEFDHKRSGTVERIHVYRCRYGHIFGFSVDPKEKQVWLKGGDRLTTTIEKLGELQFTLA